jgi:hypothetical protein
MSHFAVFHDHLNTSDEVPVDADAIVTVSVFGSGSALGLSNGQTVGVHETPSQVMELVKAAQASSE